MLGLSFIILTTVWVCAHCWYCHKAGLGCEIHSKNGHHFLEWGQFWQHKHQLHMKTIALNEAKIKWNVSSFSLLVNITAMVDSN